MHEQSPVSHHNPTEANGESTNAAWNAYNGNFGQSSGTDFDPWERQPRGQDGNNHSYRSHGAQPNRYSKPIMEYKIISDTSGIGNDRKMFREWWHKLRKNLRSVTNPEVDATFDMIERVYLEVGRNPTVIGAKIGAEMSLRGKDLTEVMEIIDMVFTNKLELGSTPYLMFKRVDHTEYYDVISRLCRVYGWYLELTGEGMNEKLARLMKPSPATKESDTLGKLMKF